MEISPQEELDEFPSLEGPAPTNRNLLASPRLKSFLKSKWYPAVVQVPTFFVFGLIMYLLLFGPEHIEENFGSALTWILWWPLIPFFFLFIGRFWCAICPFATVSDLVQKIGLKKPIPVWLRKYGIWIIDLSLIFAIVLQKHVSLVRIKHRAALSSNSPGPWIQVLIVICVVIV